MKRPDITQTIRKAMHQMFPGVEIWLFGSEARGDARPDSDVDLLILLDKEEIPVEDEMQISDPLYKIEFETGIPINPFILSKKLWGKIATPFYENVMRERLAL